MTENSEKNGGYKLPGLRYLWIRINKIGRLKKCELNGSSKRGLARFFLKADLVNYGGYKAFRPPCCRSDLNFVTEKKFGEAGIQIASLQTRHLYPR